jgi:hypothetical protein
MIRYQPIAIVCLALSVGACATVSAGTGDDLSTAVKSLATQTDTLASVVKTESDAKPTVRRDEAIRYWISHGDDTTGTNINSSNPQDSFARYVCAGTGALGSVNASLTYMKAYSSAAQAAVDPGPDTFTGQFAKFLDQNSAAKVIKLPADSTTTAAGLFTACFNNVNSLLDIYNRGMTASDTSDEFVLAAIPAIISAGQTLVSSLETLAKDALKALNAVQQRKHLQAFIAANATDITKVENNLQTNSKLDDAWQRREAFVLGTAYEKFKIILNDKNPKADTSKVRAAGLEVSSELATYDAMVATKKPSEVVKAWMAAQTTLEKDAKDNSISVASIIAFMQSVESDFSTIKSDYADTGTKFNALVQSLKDAKK